MIGARSIVVDSLVVLTIERIKFKTLCEKTSRDFREVVTEGSVGTPFQVLRLRHHLPVAHNLSIVGVNLQCLLDMFLAQISLAIVK